MVAKLEFSKTGTIGEWITLAENLTNVNYYVWEVPNLERNDNYICVTVTDASAPERTVSEVVPVRIANTADSQITLGFLFVPGIAIIVFALARKQATRIFNNRALSLLQVKAAKYPHLHNYLGKIESLISTFRFKQKGDINN